MKKKITIALTIICLIFLMGGTYTIITMETATAKLDYVVMLHQVEIVREQLLRNIKRVESDLKLRNTPHATGIDIVIDNVTQLESGMGTCFACHRSAKAAKWLEKSTNERVLKTLNGLKNEINEYKESLSRFLTLRANRYRTEIEYNNALNSAQKLATDLDNIVHTTSAKLSAKTESSYHDVNRTKVILYVFMGFAPFIAAGLGLVFVGEATKPIKALLQATRRIESGDLDYRMEGLKDEFGEVAASFNEMSDSLKEHLRRIQESENRYRMLFESAADAIFIVEAEGENSGKIVDANYAAAEMHGYALDELLDLNLIKDLDTPEAAEEAPERIRRILNGEWVHAEINHIKKDGTVFPVEISAGLLEYMDRKYILAVDRDISDRKRMENEILQSKIDWEDTFNTITDMITIHDKEFNIIGANKAAKEILGLPFLEARNAKCYEYYHGQDRPPEECLSCECVNTQKPATFELFEPHLNRFIEVRAMPRFDTDNQMVGLIHVIRDITERKRLEEVLQRAEQMKTVGEWATGLVHEIKNPLAGIKGSVEVLADEASISDEDRVIISQAVDEIKRIEVLLKSLLSFAKPPKPDLALIDINEILDKTITFALRHSPLLSGPSTSINVFKDFDPKLPKTMADPMQIQQAFLNLLLNAIDAMPDGGMLATKTCYDKKLDYIQIMISDTGSGMDKEIADKVFQPFFTTKRKGTGLGLAITRRLIEQHGGHIQLDNVPGKGSAFNIFLSLKEEKKEHVA